MTLKRLQNKFSENKKNNKSSLIIYVMAGAPDMEKSSKILSMLPAAGADIIELGIPFSDPVADGPVIQNAAQDALKQSITIKDILSMVAKFRKDDSKTPIVLMGYLNPILSYGQEKFVEDAVEAGVDGLLVVDVPIEEEGVIKNICEENSLGWIRLVTPTSDDKRIENIVQSASGFVYYVAVAGVTGGKSATIESVKNAVGNIKKYTDTPIAVGFGVKNSNDVASISKVADAVVVGSAVVKELKSKGVDSCVKFVNKINQSTK